MFNVSELLFDAVPFTALVESQVKADYRCDVHLGGVAAGTVQFSELLSLLH
jgi:hypothetical protein